MKRCYEYIQYYDWVLLSVYNGSSQMKRIMLDNQWETARCQQQKLLSDGGQVTKYDEEVSVPLPADSVVAVSIDNNVVNKIMTPVFKPWQIGFETNTLPRSLEVSCT